MVIANGASLVNILLVELFTPSLALLRNLYEFLVVIFYPFVQPPRPVPGMRFLPSRFLIIFNLLNGFPFNSRGFFLFSFSGFSSFFPL